MSTMTKTSPWWVCKVCKKPVQKVGSRRKLLGPKIGHRQVCPNAVYSIKQVKA